VTRYILIGLALLVPVIMAFFAGWQVRGRRSDNLEAELAAAQARGRETEQWADDLTGQRDQARAAAEQLAADCDDLATRLAQVQADLHESRRVADRGHLAYGRMRAERDDLQAQLDAITLDPYDNPLMLGLVAEHRVTPIDEELRTALVGFTGEWRTYPVAAVPDPVAEPESEPEPEPVLPAELERVARNVTPPKGVPTPKRPPRQAKRALRKGRRRHEYAD
jgi:F0F1-type ATP synthase membrane subunit b/b'